MEARMARAVPKRIVVGLIAALAAAAIPVGSVIAAQSAAPIPDFTGIWGHNAMAPELITSGPKPQMNLGRQNGDTTDPSQGGDPLCCLSHLGVPTV
jgi:hypothetical protein